MNNTKSIRNSTVDKTKKEQLNRWVIQEIESRKYTQKQMDTIMFLAKKGKQKEAWRILLKGHKCPVNCYCDSICWNLNCQKETNTWQEKMNKAQTLLELAEREGNEARELRIKETVHLLTQRFKQYEQ